MGDKSLKDFNLIMETENPAKKITLQWSIRNVHKIPGSIRSNKFSLVPDQPKHWDVSICLKTDDTFQFSMAYHAMKEAVPVLVKSEFRILRSEGSLVGFNSHSHDLFHGGDRHPLFTGIKCPESEDNKLIFQFSMTVRGYGLNCSRDLYSDDGRRDVEELKNDFLNMLKSKVFADLAIKVGGKCFIAHRCVLKSFAPKFYSEHADMIEKGEISLIADDYLFDDVLQNIYCGKINQIPILLNLKQFYEVAIWFGLRSLQRASTMDIIYGMKIGDVCEFYELAEENEDEKLVKYCEAFIKDNLRALESNVDEYKKFRASRPHLPMILESKNETLRFIDDCFL